MKNKFIVRSITILGVIIFNFCGYAYAQSVNNKVCSSIKPYGDIKICLPIDGGMTECYSNQNIKNRIEKIYSSKNFIFFGVYINNSTYKKGLSTSLNNESIFVFAPRELIGVKINQDYIDNLSSKLGNEIKVDWKELMMKIDKYHNYTSKTGKPLLLGGYKPYNSCFSKIILAQKSFQDNYLVLVEILDMIEIKHRLIAVLYGIKFNGEASIKDAKAKNDMFVLKLINANK